MNLDNQNVTLIMAITQHSVFLYQIRLGTVTKESFIAFLIEIAKKLSTYSKEYIKRFNLIIDLAPPHLAKLTKHYLSLMPFTICFSSPTNPNLSCIEPCFSMIKSFIKNTKSENLYFCKLEIIDMV